jgi:hypothetical protein
LRLPSGSPLAFFIPRFVNKMVRSLSLSCCIVIVLVCSILFCKILGGRII